MTRHIRVRSHLMKVRGRSAKVRVAGHLRKAPREERRGHDRDRRE